MYDTIVIVHISGKIESLTDRMMTTTMWSSDDGHNVMEWWQTQCDRMMTNTMWWNDDNHNVMEWWQTQSDRLMTTIMWSSDEGHNVMECWQTQCDGMMTNIMWSSDDSHNVRCYMLIILKADWNSRKNVRLTFIMTINIYLPDALLNLGWMKDCFLKLSTTNKPPALFWHLFWEPYQERDSV